jgi:hypothetical protein
MAGGGEGGRMRTQSHCSPLGSRRSRSTNLFCKGFRYWSQNEAKPKLRPVNKVFLNAGRSYQSQKLRWSIYASDCSQVKETTAL